MSGVDAPVESLMVAKTGDRPDGEGRFSDRARKLDKTPANEKANVRVCAKLAEDCEKPKVPRVVLGKGSSFAKFGKTECSVTPFSYRNNANTKLVRPSIRHVTASRPAPDFGGLFIFVVLDAPDADADAVAVIGDKDVPSPWLTPLSVVFFDKFTVIPFSSVQLGLVVVLTPSTKLTMAHFVYFMSVQDDDDITRWRLTWYAKTPSLSCTTCTTPGEPAKFPGTLRFGTHKSPMPVSLIAGSRFDQLKGACWSSVARSSQFACGVVLCSSTGKPPVLTLTDGAVLLLRLIGKLPHGPSESLVSSKPIAGG